MRPDLTDTLGMVLRMNTNGSVPKDNPFVGNDAFNDLTWAVSLRNSTGLALNPELANSGSVIRDPPQAASSTCSTPGQTTAGRTSPTAAVARYRSGQG
ncbi:MAG: PQQ-dependent sugar dehydrogenase [Pseudomonadota bacterium]